jgi:AraC-like DNA-binding protein
MRILSFLLLSSAVLFSKTLVPFFPDTREPSTRSACAGGLECAVYDLNRGGAFTAPQPITFPHAGLRFYFSYDSLRIDSLMEWARNVAWARDEGFPSLIFFRLVTDDYSELPYQQRVASFCMARQNGEWRLIIYLFTHKSEEWKQKTIIALDPCLPVCLEYRLSFNADTSAGPVVFRVNGRTVWEEDMTVLNFKVKRLLPKFGIEEQKYHGAGRLYFAGIVFADGFPGGMPGPPVIGPRESGRSAFNAMEVRLVSPPYSAFLSPTRHAASQFQIRLKDRGWDLPLYDSGPDTASKNSLLHRVSLDPAREYQWRVRHLNDQGNYSEWSGPALLARGPDSAKISRPAVLGLRFFRPGSRRPVRSVWAGAWYDAALKVWDPAGWENISYAVMIINNTASTQGMPVNKGGRFDPESNYYVNVSLNPDKIFEKSTVGTYARTRLIDSTGIYVDARRSIFRKKPADSTIRFRMRLFPAARTGLWCVRAVVWNEQERPSYFFYDTLRVAPSRAARRKATRLYWPDYLLVLLLSGFAAWLVFRTRQIRKPAPSGGAPPEPTREQKIFNGFKDYVRANLKNALSRAEIEAHMKMSYSNVYRIVRIFSNASIKNFILRERIEKAKALLSETRLSVTEVMLESGFSDSAHFSRSFKKHAGASPTDFRKSRWG